LTQRPVTRTASCQTAESLGSTHARYLVAITSDAENQFVATKTDAENVWIGTTSDEATLAALNPAITGHVHNCEYYWADGSAAGQPTTSGCVSPAAVNGSYNAWATGEPNNYGTTEACGVDNWQGSRGSWNDLDCDTDAAAGYLVEFDTSASDFEGKALVFNDLTGQGVDAVPAAAPALATTGGSLFPAIELGAIVSIAGAVLLVVARRKAAKK
jgi:hypothetical protein